VAERPAIASRIAATGMLGGPVTVLLSGGRDSVCLLDAALLVAPSGQVDALHVNYGLRGQESDDDEDHCVTLCDELGVELTVHHAHAPAGPGNLHAWARDLRYAVGASLTERSGGVLAAAHTVDDQVETVLYRLATSPGRRALAGIAESSGRLVRPLLAASVTRAETTAWCEQGGLRFRDDSSNEDPRFARARIRHDLVPAFAAVDERAIGALLQTTRLLREEGEALDALIAQLTASGRLSRSELERMPTALARLALRAIAERAVGASCPRVAARLDDVLALADGSLDLGDGVRVTVAGDRVTASPTPPLPAGDRDHC